LKWEKTRDWNFPAEASFSSHGDTGRVLYGKEMISTSVREGI
jgi:hypothetical protein